MGDAFFVGMIQKVMIPSRSEISTASGAVISHCNQGLPDIEVAPLRTAHLIWLLITDFHHVITLLLI
jgi:hypothetical protein